MSEYRVCVKGFGDGRWYVEAVEYLQGHFILTLENSGSPNPSTRPYRLILKRA